MKCRVLFSPKKKTKKKNKQTNKQNKKTTNKHETKLKYRLLQLWSALQRFSCISWKICQWWSPDSEFLIKIPIWTHCYALFQNMCLPVPFANPRRYLITFVKFLYLWPVNRNSLDVVSLSLSDLDSREALKAPITTATYDILKYFFFFSFSKKISLDISTIHVKSQDLFVWKKKMSWAL